MKADSMSVRTFVLMASRTGSCWRVSVEPPRSSSQLGPQVMVGMCSPVIWLLARATGRAGESLGAESRRSYSYVHGS